MGRSSFRGSLLLLASALASCSLARVYDTRFDGVTWDNENWILKTTTLDQGHYQSRMSLANGYLGINLAAVGPFFEVDAPVNGDAISGWPLFSRRQTFATISGFWDSQPTTNGSNFPWLYQYGGESVISGVPHWAGLVVDAGGGQVLDASVDASQISGFSSAMDFRAGVLSWNYTWAPAGGSPPLSVAYTMLVHKLLVNQAAVRLSLTAAEDTSVTVTDVLEGDCAVRTDFVDKGSDPNGSVIWTAVRPSGIGDVAAYIYSTLSGEGTSTTQTAADSPLVGANQSSIAQSAQVSLKAGSTVSITKYVGGASTDAFADPQAVARNASSAAAATGFDGLLRSHEAEWASILTPDSVDDYSLENGTLPADPYIIEEQIVAVTNPYQMLQNTVGSHAVRANGNNSMLNANSISVGGLGSDSYAGLVFWDADIWMSSGLVVAFPDAAKTFADYRARLFPQARRNVETAFSSSQNETGKFTNGSGAVFPWTSGRFGNCTGTGPCFDYEYHINGDIGLDLYNYYVVTGDVDTFSRDYFPVYEGIANFYSELVSLNESTGLYTLSNATDPDEYANFVNNPGFTMTLIKTHIDTANAIRSSFGEQIDDVAANVSAHIDIPVDDEANLILEYSGMNGSISVKQADVVLIDDFLDYPNAYTLSNLDYYAGKQSPNGPGMTYGVFSIVANGYSPSGCSAYTYGVYASHPYARAPWFQYSEQLVDDYGANGGTHPAYPFVTGMGGANRVAVFGYLGLRLRPDALRVDPALPPQIPRLAYRTFYWQGHAVRAASNATHTVLRRVPGVALPGANAAYLDAPIPVTVGGGGGGGGSNATAVISRYELPASGEPAVLPNRQPGLVATWPGNAAQCRPARSAQAFAPGQFPFAANDGAAGTRWQPAAAYPPASVTVDLGVGVGDGAAAAGRRAAGFRFDWAQAPPRGYSVAFTNDSSIIDGAGGLPLLLLVNATVDDAVEISDPYDPAAAGRIRPYASNTTNVTLGGGSPVYAGRYAVLTIWGNQESGDEGVGATVAEFAVIFGEDNNTGGAGGGGIIQSSVAHKVTFGRGCVALAATAVMLAVPFLLEGFYSGRNGLSWAFIT